MSAETSRYWTLIAAAGSGTRMAQDTPKQHTRIDQKTILEHAIQPFLDNEKIQHVFVILPSQDTHFKNSPLAQHSKISQVIGGATRAHSIQQGLLALKAHAKKNDWVLIHDGARPCISLSDINKLIESVGNHQIGGLLVKPVTDTIKEKTENGQLRTLPRGALYHALTPQLFRYGLLCEALEAAFVGDISVTDEASAVEALGHTPLCIEGDRKNIKITFPEDKLLAEIYLALLHKDL